MINGSVHNSEKCQTRCKLPKVVKLQNWRLIDAIVGKENLNKMVQNETPRSQLRRNNDNNNNNLLVFPYVDGIT